MTPPRERWIAYEDRDGPHRRRLDVGEWVIGRATDCDIVVNDFALSSRHAKLVVDEQAVRVVDLQSKGGTQVNAVPVLEARLADGDHIRLGQFRVRFFDGSDAPPREDAVVPEAWRHVAPDKRALIRRIEAVKGKPPESLDEHSSLGELGSTLHSVMYVVSAIESECGVKLPQAGLMRIHTIGELVDLICNAPKVRGELS